MKLPSLLNRSILNHSIYFIRRPFTTHMNGSKNFNGESLADLTKSHTFTANLPADPRISSPEESKIAEQNLLRTARLVHGSLFTWVAPEKSEDAKLLAVSPSTQKLIGLKSGEEATEEFLELVSGNKIYEENYPWAQCYGGFQFGTWAGQLGDGRAFSLFEVTNRETGRRFEVQLKGGGKTPYSRFADGRAVLRSSIREFLASEALASLDIPTTRALALVLLPHVGVLRERMEPGAIVCRVAETWIRIGTFDLPRARGDSETIRKLADYCIEHVFDLGANCDVVSTETDKEPRQLNRYGQLYREICLRSAKLVSKMQVYGFMNGVLNTDNTSIYGLSLDYGPFAFMDTFDPAYTPNHDDHSLRYSYRMQPTIFWWNLVRLGEDLGELFGAEADVDSEWFRKRDSWTDEQKDKIIKTAEDMIEEIGEEFKNVFMKDYKTLMAKRFGLREVRDGDMEFFTSGLDIMENTSADFQHFFYRLSDAKIFGTNIDYKKIASDILPAERLRAQDTQDQLAEWLEKVYKPRLETEGTTDDEARGREMKKVNPKFVLRNWVLDEVIKYTEKEKDGKLVNQVLEMALNPFETKWESIEESESERYCGDVPRQHRSSQCSCSS